MNHYTVFTTRSTTIQTTYHYPFVSSIGLHLRPDSKVTITGRNYIVGVGRTVMSKTKATTYVTLTPVEPTSCGDLESEGWEAHR